MSAIHAASYVVVPDGTMQLQDYIDQRPDYPSVMIHLGPNDITRCSELVTLLKAAVNLRALEVFVNFGTRVPNKCVKEFRELSHLLSLTISYQYNKRTRSGIISTTKTLTQHRSVNPILSSQMPVRSSRSPIRSASPLRSSVRSSSPVKSSVRSSSPVRSASPVRSSVRSSSPRRKVGGCFATISNEDLVRIFDANFIRTTSRLRGPNYTAQFVTVGGHRLRHKLTEISAQRVSELIHENPTIYAEIMTPEIRTQTSLDMPGPESTYRTCLYRLRDPAGTIYREDIIIFVE